MSKEKAQQKAAKAAQQRLRDSRSRARDPELMLKAIRNGDRSALGQALTMLESRRLEDRDHAQELLQLALPFAGGALRIGITGVPGVGKSTFIEALGLQLTEKGHQLAVLAIDPSSKRSKGSILGDKTRMEKLSANEKAFIRPSPSSSALGGVARKTREAIVLCEAANYDIIFVETVGVGQSEIAVHSMVDCFLLLMLAGAGDELQGIKRGIMEMADILAITKADGDNVRQSKIARRSYANALHLFPPSPSEWTPKVLTCSAYENDNIDKVWETVEEFIRHMKIKGFFETKRHEQDLNWFKESVHDQVLDNFFSNSRVQELLPRLEEDIKAGKITPFAAAAQLLKENYR